MNPVQAIRDTTAVLITGIALLAVAWDLARPAADLRVFPDRGVAGETRVWLVESR